MPTCTTQPAPMLHGHLQGDDYDRYGIPIPPCQVCNGYGTRDGRPARDWDPRQDACVYCGGLGEDLDAMTADLTAFPTFRALLEAPGGYRPTLWTARRDCDDDGQAREQDGPKRALADAYDQAQANRGDRRRAYRGY